MTLKQHKLLKVDINELANIINHMDEFEYFDFVQNLLTQIKKNKAEVEYLLAKQETIDCDNYGDIFGKEQFVAFLNMFAICGTTALVTGIVNKSFDSVAIPTLISALLGTPVAIANTYAYQRKPVTNFVNRTRVRLIENKVARISIDTKYMEMIRQMLIENGRECALLEEEQICEEYKNVPNEVGFSIK